jgi:hypothetical protein
MTVCRPGALVSSCLSRVLIANAQDTPLVMNLSWTMTRVPTVAATFDTCMLAGPY